MKTPTIKSDQFNVYYMQWTVAIVSLVCYIQYIACRNKTKKCFNNVFHGLHDKHVLHKRKFVSCPASRMKQRIANGDRICIGRNT